MTTATSTATVSPLETLIVSQLESLRSAEQKLAEQYVTMDASAFGRDKFSGELARLQDQADRLLRMMGHISFSLPSAAYESAAVTPAAA